MKKLVEIIRKWFSEITKNEAERYLEQATDHADLERRIRELERNCKQGLCK